jgi:hypothetical protein
VINWKHSPFIPLSVHLEFLIEPKWFTFFCIMLGSGNIGVIFVHIHSFAIHTICFIFSGLKLGHFFTIRYSSTPALCYVGLLVFQRFAMCVLASILIVFFSHNEYQGLEIECWHQIFKVVGKWSWKTMISYIPILHKLGHIITAIVKLYVYCFSNYKCSYHLYYKSILLVAIFEPNLI